MLEGIENSDKTPGDRCRPRPSIGLDDIAIDPYGALPQHLEIHHRAQRAADQPLDLMRPSANPPTRRLARAPRSRGPRQHRILRGQPALSTVTTKWRYTLFNARRTDHFRIPNLDENRAFGVLIEVTCEPYWP
jgi:hypothetical protein